MANINVVVEKPIADGYKLKFRTPCDSTTIEGLEVKYPAKNGVGTLIKKFVFKDAHGTELSGVGNLFVSGVMIEVLLDVTHNVAYIQNADTNSYVESVKGEIKRLEESQKQFLAVAGEAVRRCENIADSADGFEKAMTEATERSESVKGVYVGEGDMPEGYGIQIDPNGAAYEMDTELNEISQNPVTNAAITQGINDVRETLSGAISTLGETTSGLSETVDELNSTVAEHKEALEELSGDVAKNEEDISELDTKATQHEDKINKITIEFLRKGFGLGTNAPERTVESLEALDTLKETGWYSLDVSALSGDRADIFGVYFNYATVHVVAIEDGTFYQELYIHPHSSQSVIRRWHTSEGFSPWEHTNPPMAFDKEYRTKEYRTTERFDGKAVYKKAFNIGPLPMSGDRWVTHDIANLNEVVGIKGMIKKDGKWSDFAQVQQSVSLSVDNQYINMRTAIDMSSYSAKIVLEYTKN